MRPDIPFKKSKRGITINVKVEPRSPKSEITGVLGNALKVRLKSPPVDGRANEELVFLLSKEFGVGKTSVRILKGHKSKNKVVEIEGGERALV